jgi:hypothetical protein
MTNLTPKLPAMIVRPAQRWLAAVLLVAAAACTLASCAPGPNADLAGPEYPIRDQGRTLDIQVVRDETRIRLTNTTARGFGAGRLWINRWYSLPIERLEVGQTLDLDLWDFRDRHGEPFQAGGFFATRKPERLVLAQLESGDELLGLVVVGRGED